MIKTPNNGIMGRINQVLRDIDSSNQSGLGQQTSTVSIGSGSSYFDDEVLKSPVPVLVDFFATWCGPCKSISPHIDRLGDKYKGQMKVVKVDIEKYGALKRQYQIMGVPTLLMFNHGEEVDRLVGAHAVSTIEQMILKYTQPFTGTNGVDESFSSSSQQTPLDDLDKFVRRRFR